MKAPKPDKNGNFVFRPSLLKTVPLTAMIVFSAVITVLSVISVITGDYINIKDVIVRIALCVIICGVSLYMLLKSPRYVITSEKVLLYGKWEMYFSEIESVELHDNILGMVEIKGKNGDFTVFSHDISCPVRVFCEILSERISLYE